MHSRQRMESFFRWIHHARRFLSVHLTDVAFWMHEIQTDVGAAPEQPINFRRGKRKIQRKSTWWQRKWQSKSKMELGYILDMTARLAMTTCWIKLRQFVLKSNGEWQSKIPRIKMQMELTYIHISYLCAQRLATYSGLIVVVVILMWSLSNSSWDIHRFWIHYWLSNWQSSMRGLSLTFEPITTKSQWVSILPSMVLTQPDSRGKRFKHSSNSDAGCRSETISAVKQCQLWNIFSCNSAAKHWRSLAVEKWNQQRWNSRFRSSPFFGNRLTANSNQPNHFKLKSSWNFNRFKSDGNRIHSTTQGGTDGWAAPWKPELKNVLRTNHAPATSLWTSQRLSAYAPAIARLKEKINLRWARLIFEFVQNLQIVVEQCRLLACNCLQCCSFPAGPVV